MLLFAGEDIHGRTCKLVCRNLSVDIFFWSEELHGHEQNGSCEAATAGGAGGFCEWRVKFLRTVT